MSFEAFIQKVQSLESLTANEELFKNTAQLKADLSVYESSEYEEQRVELEKEGRLLKIGILGRVKAGKSSLLNAILFKGEDILPKAATPMTAALSVLEYSDTLGFEAEFYDEADLATIKKDALKYEEFLS